MDDLTKLKSLLIYGYWIETINEDSEGNCIIFLMFSGNGMPVEGPYYYLITKDKVVIKKAHEVSGK